MKVKLISDTTNYGVEDKINKFISRDDISIIDIKYSPVCVQKRESIGNTIQDIDVVIHKALILYDERKARSNCKII